MMQQQFFPSEKKPLLFAHRGYSSIAAENTLSAFMLAVEQGIPGVELDVHLCKTGELVVIHDHNLKRVANVDAEVEQSTFAFLRSLDVGSHKDPSYTGEKIPLLRELFEQCGSKLYYDIELKVRGKSDTGLAKKTWETICEYHMQDRCMVSSFNPLAIRYFNDVSNKSIPTAVIYSDTDDLPKILRHGWGRHIAKATILKPDRKLVDEHMINSMKNRRGYPIVVWTVDDLSEGIRLLDMGVDGIISNNPKLFVKELQTRHYR
ncbi:MAG: glycerophosphodiester phosphodiesterase family protein [Sphaerochaetaceae bacterium]|nr:glycerophosphodiester phosphodiesterase family protein [Sphaerochaetaceae bacterium]